MINTKEKTLEYWNERKLRQSGHDSNARKRNYLDAWFINKGFTPVHRAYSKYYSEYYNEQSGQAIYVNEIDYFDDSLMDVNSWALIWSFNKTSYYFAPYNALYDFGTMWETREKTYTDRDNSTASQLQETLELLIENGIAYEL
jgi:hypothetical protein